MASDELQNMLDRVHDGITSFDYDQKRVPCILVPERKFDEIIRSVVGKPVSVPVDLNIYQDYLGHVFVGVDLAFSGRGIRETFLVNANTSLDFFELLAGTSMLAVAPRSGVERGQVFMIQLPRPDKAVDALARIRSALKPGRIN